MSANLIESTAKAMVDDGMAAAGYRYVNIDDCWMDGNQYARTDPRRATAGRVDGHLVADPTNFPDGIKPVADYVHSLGLKLGIYESAGSTTCQGLAGSLGHELTDAEDFASWGVDYVKYDNCGDHGSYSDDQAGYIARYKAMGDALRQASNDTGHAIVYSVCEWGNFQPWTWAADKAEAELWRTTGDIADTWASTVSLFKQNIALSQYSHAGAYNDPDMLEIGNGGQTDTEYRSQFSLWSMMAAPLIAGTPIAAAGGKAAATDATLGIYTNRDVIAVDQDRLGSAATVYSHVGDQWVLTRPLANGDVAVLFFNESSTPALQSVSISSLLRRAGSSYLVRDLWAHRNSTVANTLHASVAGHGVRMFRISATGTPSSAGAHVELSGATATQYVEAGTSTAVTEALYNDGRAAITHLAITLSDVPTGWTVHQTRRGNTTVSGTSSTTARWTVAVPAGTPAGTYPINVVAAYRGGIATSAVTVRVPPPPPTTTAYLSDLDWTASTGTVYRDKQVTRDFQTGTTTDVPLTVAGTSYAKGLGASTGTDIQYYLGGHCTSLSLIAGVDDTAIAFGGGTPTAEVDITIDGTSIYAGTLTKGTAVPLTENITGAGVLELSVQPSGGFASTPVDWAAAQVTCS